MHIARYEIDGRIHYGALEGNSLKRLAGSPFETVALDGTVDRLDRARLLCPVEAPRIFGAGLNYISHIEEMKLTASTIPLLFMKPATAAIGPGDDIIYPRSEKAIEVHFEGELAIVVGRRARRLSRSDALSAVLGYTCANDVSERTIQKLEMAMGHLLIGKSFDTFCPIGPTIATGLDPGDLLLETHVNGKRRQSVRTSDLLFSAVDLLVHISNAVTLLPGDVILTGTPSGIGPVVPGDVVDITIEGIGTLHNAVVAEAAA